MTTRPSWLRNILIRGDGTALGVVLILLAVVGATVAFLGVVPMPVAAFAGASALIGARLVCWNRSRYRAMLAEVAERHRDEEPGPSPVSWLSDPLWRATNRFDPVLDGPVELMSEVDPLIRPFADDARGAFVTPTLRQVSGEDRQMITPAALEAGLLVSEAAPGTDLLTVLKSTPGRQVAVEPRWPVCCQRLSTLLTDEVGRRNEALYLDIAHAELTPAGLDGRGRHRFQCRACGRMYATDPAW